jgi:hypothetical protein
MLRWILLLGLTFAFLGGVAGCNKTPTGTTDSAPPEPPKDSLKDGKPNLEKPKGKPGPPLPGH